MKPYRIKWAIVEVCNGNRCRKEMRCIAERIVSFLWIKFYWPINGKWRSSEYEAKLDIDHHKEMLELPHDKYID